MENFYVLPVSCYFILLLNWKPQREALLLKHFLLALITTDFLTKLIRIMGVAVLLKAHFVWWLLTEQLVVMVLKTLNVYIFRSVLIHSLMRVYIKCNFRKKNVLFFYLSNWVLKLTLYLPYLRGKLILLCCWVWAWVFYKRCEPHYGNVFLINESFWCLVSIYSYNFYG